MALFVLSRLDKRDSLDLRLGGPCPGATGQMVGSLTILEAEDLAAAEACGAADPYRLTGLFERVEVRPRRNTAGSIA
ncbi:MAG TPA: YciI family protein [Caulobacteraceae bacterium]|nr:YciI family protein [Caulobacteraceae bacterium]